ncbi:sensor histidine kinase [Mucilaginibacter sp. L3T2-6]|uniref:sensor histidine kinase n=1 Tax=Mucilaginibacter sp. L3T2-6 TaxID=3062491 RepID=UPI002674BDBF|nr:sensor histidine kinase [Mucilaginibacter sp. L3T2-6]MDO3642523.1 PAS domain S-box protein [Mucilaginibacter sp. L3T2-6]MDV6215081.1 PAS domain S-box protein [Mucilaginibacter sp. L3T2-6]
MIVEEKHLSDATLFIDFDLENDHELLDIVGLASAITNSPFITIALQHDGILHLKVRRGIDVEQVEAYSSLCAHALNQPGLTVVADTFKDKLYGNNLNVCGGPGIRFFAGMPLITAAGIPVGVLGVYDVIPKILDEHQALVLKILAGQAIKIIELKAGAEILRTKQKELEEQRQFNTDASIRLRSFFESSTNFHVLLGKSGEVIDFNKTAVGFIRTVHKAVLVRDDQFIKYLHPAFVSTFLKRYNEALEGKKSFEEGSTYYEDMGTIWWEAAFEAARNNDDEIIGVSYLIRNVTERKLKEQKIIEQNKSLLKIAHIQAHEFRAPLTSIMGLMGLIKDADYNAPREYLEMLGEAVYALDDKIKSIVADIDNMVVSPFVSHYD